MPTLSPTTSLPDQPLNRFWYKAHPRVFVSLCGITILISFCLYSIFVLYPSYQSGIYQSEDPTQEHFVVPFYTSDASGLSDYSNPIWTINTFVSLFALFFIPPLTLALLFVLVKKRQFFTRKERWFWLGIFVAIWIGYILTLPAAANFQVWVAD